MKTLHAVLFFVLLFVPEASYAQHEKAPDCTALMGKLPKPFDGVAFAIDGSTVGIVAMKPHVRIWGIQAPELRDKINEETVVGMRARAALEDLLASANHKIHCNPTRWDRYCRLVASCVAKTTDIGGRMIEDGMAYGFRLDDVSEADLPLSLSYAESEADARKQKRGLWPIWLGEPSRRP